MSLLRPIPERTVAAAGTFTSHDPEKLFRKKHCSADASHSFFWIDYLELVLQKKYGVRWARDGTWTLSGGATNTHVLSLVTASDYAGAHH